MFRHNLEIYFSQLAKAHCELNKRIYEHDKCMAEGKTDKHEVTLQVCHNRINCLKWD